MSDNTKKAQCIHCFHFFSKDSNSTLKNHISHPHCEALKRVAESGQSSMSRDGSIFVYNPDVLREQFAGLVIQRGLPFNHFDDEQTTRVFQKHLQPKYNHIKPNTWKMMKRVIAFKDFLVPHTSSALARTLRKTFVNFNLENKIMSITLDNASNNTSAIGKLKLKYEPPMDGRFYHSRCVAHIINLVVQDGLAVPAINAIKESFKTMLKDVFKSSARNHQCYIKICSEAGKPCLSPNWDILIRWNSTYHMFLCGLKQRSTLMYFHDLLASKGTDIKKMTKLKTKADKTKHEIPNRCCSKGSLEDKILVSVPDSSERPLKIEKICLDCGDPVHGLYCRQCALIRKTLEEVFQDFQDTSKSSDDDTNFVNQEPFVVKQGPGVNSSQSPPQINHHCCYECGDSLDGIFCQRCTCKSCGKGAHIGYNCPPQIPIISNPEPCYNQNLNEILQNLQSLQQQCLFGTCQQCGCNEYDGVCFYCTVGNGTSINFSTPYSSNDSPSVANHPPQPQYVPYSCELCGNDSHYGYDCPPQVPRKKKSELKKMQAAKDRYWKIPVCYDDDDDEESSIPLKDIISELPPCVAITPDSPKTNSLIMEDEHLDTIPETESDELIKSSVEDLVQKSQVSPKIAAEGLIKLMMEVVRKYPIPIPPGIEVIFVLMPKSDLLESLLTIEILSINYSQKIDISSLMSSPLNSNFPHSIPPRIDDVNLDPEGDILFLESLLYDNSSPRPPEEFNSENSIESFPPSHISVEDSDSYGMRCDIFLEVMTRKPPGEISSFLSLRALSFQAVSSEKPDVDSWRQHSKFGCFRHLHFYPPLDKPSMGIRRLAPSILVACVSVDYVFQDFPYCDDSRLAVMSFISLELHILSFILGIQYPNLFDYVYRLANS
ncbi:zinc finger BED domain-containing protein RICESLEEPER 2-like protein [Tanacetum coccineum]